MSSNLDLIPELLRLFVRSGGNPLVLIGQVLGVLPKNAPGGLGVIRRVLGSHQAKLISVWLAGKLENLSRDDIKKLLAVVGAKASIAGSLLLKRIKQGKASPERPAKEPTDEADKLDIRELLDNWKQSLKGKSS